MPRKTFDEMDWAQKDEALGQIQTRITQIRGELRRAAEARTTGEKNVREDEAGARMREIRRELRELGLKDTAEAQA